MEVTIEDRGFIKHDINPSHEGCFSKQWQLGTWGCDDIGMLTALIYSQSRYDSNGEPIDPMTVVTKCPVAALKYHTHRSKFSNIDWNLLSPSDMLKIWKIKESALTKENSLKVTVSHEVVNGKVKLKSVGASGKSTNKNKHDK